MLQFVTTTSFERNFDMANMIKYKVRQYFGFFHPILTWEHHCFGYRKGGHESDTVSDGYETNVTWNDDTHYTVSTTEKSHVVRYAYFKRHEEYPKNPIFMLLELLMNIVSYVRVYLCKFLFIGYLLTVTILADAGLTELGENLVLAALAIYGLSIAIPLAGYIVRQVFGLDKKIDDICDENGWQRWSDYQDE